MKLLARGKIGGKHPVVKLVCDSFAQE